jgi:uncharacterized protein
MKNSLITIIIIITTILAICFTYLFEEVNIKVDGVTLHGTITKSGNEHDTIVVIIAGSGPTDRDGNSDLIEGRNDSLLLLAKGLNKKGIDTFRYDKRATSKYINHIDIESINFDTFVNDVVSCVQYLKSKNYSNIYLAGHSQGSLVGILTAQKESVAGFISLAGPARRVDYSLEEQLTAAGQYNKYENIFKSLRHNKIVENVDDNNMFSIINQKFILSWMKYTPFNEAQKLNIPLLFINGDADTQVGINELKVFQSYVPEAEYEILKDTNHVLKIVENKDDNTESYIKPWYKFNERIIERIFEFIIEK